MTEQPANGNGDLIYDLACHALEYEIRGDVDGRNNVIDIINERFGFDGIVIMFQAWIEILGREYGVEIGNDNLSVMYVDHSEKRITTDGAEMEESVERAGLLIQARWHGDFPAYSAIIEAIDSKEQFGALANSLLGICATSIATIRGGVPAFVDKATAERAMRIRDIRPPV